MGIDARSFEAASWSRLDIEPLKMRTRRSRNVEQPVTEGCGTLFRKNVELNCTALPVRPISSGSPANQSALQYKIEYPRCISPPQTQKSR